ncbi:MAG: response regulator transcription factor [Bacteroidales bacterium]|nr:response regulator transcription factor [Bacteroidales bacterium]MDD3906775.1 response regulator transcription factor [Bacteroidales bacterium]MDD4712077.1 response regulator transcription factor [Bacteroidales bacterium]
MKVLIADDHAIVREGVKQIVKTLPEVTLIEEAIDGNDAFSKICNTEYDLVILDISMPGMSGLDVLQRIKDRNIQTHLLIFSFYPQEQYAIRAFKLGASGYLSKDSAFDELAKAIRKIAAGEKYVSAALAEKLIFQDSSMDGKLPHEQLSEREFQVMILLAKGKSVMEIANEIFISDKTVSTYRMRIMEKMNLKKNADLTMYALRNKLIE